MSGTHDKNVANTQHLLPVQRHIDDLSLA